MDDRSVTALRARPLPWALTATALAVALWALWRAFGPAAHGDPVATSLLAFEKQNRLTVFSAQLAPVVAADDERLFGMIKSRQVAVIPARVDYVVDLSAMGGNRLIWDEANEQLTVTLPPLQLSTPNLDEARALYLREGVWISREAQAKLTRDNTLLAERQAAEQARNPVLLELARNAARDALRQNLAAPLAVAGHEEATVTVRFEGEPLPAR
jgi:hypothetical protein